jgi:hypothetical protein
MAVQECDIPEVQAQQLLAKLFLRLDASQHDQVPALFHPDGVWVRRGKELRGASQMIEALRDRSPTLVGHHVISNVAVEIADDGGASFAATLTVYRHDGGAQRTGPAPLTGPAAIAACRGEISRGAQGWRFSQLVVGPPTMSADIKS